MLNWGFQNLESIIYFWISTKDNFDEQYLFVYLEMVYNIYPTTSC